MVVPPQFTGEVGNFTTTVANSRRM